MDNTTTISSENDLLNNNNQTIINRYQVNLPVATAIASGSSCTTTTTLSKRPKRLESYKKTYLYTAYIRKHVIFKIRMNFKMKNTQYLLL